MEIYKPSVFLVFIIIFIINMSNLILTASNGLHNLQITTFNSPIVWYPVNFISNLVELKNYVATVFRINGEWNAFHMLFWVFYF